MASIADPAGLAGLSRVSAPLSSPPARPPAPARAGSFDRFLNLQISLVIFMQIAMALFCAIANYIWQKREGYKHYYLALDFNVQARCVWRRLPGNM